MRSRCSWASVFPNPFAQMKSLLFHGVILAAVLSGRTGSAIEPVELRQANVERVKDFAKSLGEHKFGDAAQLLAQPLQLSAGADGLRRFLEQAEMTCGHFKDCRSIEWESIADTDLLCAWTRWRETQGLYLRFAFDEAGGISGIWLEGDAAHTPRGFPESGIALRILKELVETARHSMTVSVQLPDGTAAPKSSVMIWKSVETGERSLNQQGRLWKDERSRRDWRILNGVASGSTATFTRLIPGTYRVTAREGHQQSGRIGISELIQVLETMDTTEVTVRLEPGATLEVNPVDVVTQSATQLPEISLISLAGPFDQFKPVVDQSLPVRFAGLPPGEYRLVALLRAGDPDDLQFEMKNPEQTVTIGVAPTTVDLPMKARLLTDDEINNRWAWTTFGIVADENGKPLANVEVSVATGIGTLMGGSRTRTNRNGHYRLRFCEGCWMDDPTGVCPQAAIFSVKCPGYQVKRSTRQLRTTMARKLPDGAPAEDWNPDEIPLRGQPFRLDLILGQSGPVETER